jgi:hypothetical protein
MGERRSKFPAISLTLLVHNRGSVVSVSKQTVGCREAAETMNQGPPGVLLPRTSLALDSPRHSLTTPPRKVRVELLTGQPVGMRATPYSLQSRQ